MELDQLSCVFGGCDEFAALLLLGEPGVGKSRLIERFVASGYPQKTYVTFTILNDGRLSGPLSDTLLEACLASLRGARSERKEALSAVISRLLKLNLAPVLQEIGRNIPIVSSLLKAAQADGVVLPQEFYSFTGDRSEIDMFVEIYRTFNELTDIALIIDDLHKAVDETVDVLTAGIDGLLKAKCPVRVVFGARPEILESPPANRIVRSFSELGALTTLDIGKLQESEMRHLCVEVFANAEAAAPLVETANGNPHLLFDQVVQLNIAGRLTKQGAQIRLPSDMTEKPSAHGGITDAIGSNTVQHQILAVLAICESGITPKQITILGQSIGIDTAAPVKRELDALVESGILEWRQDGFGPPAIDFSHDLFRAQILASIASGPITTRIEYGYYTMQFVEARLAEGSGISLADVLRWSDHTAKVPHLSKPILAIVLALVRALDIMADGRLVAAVIGLIRAAENAKADHIIVEASTLAHEAVRDALDSNSAAYSDYALKVCRALYTVGAYQKIVDLQIPEDSLTPETEYYTVAACLILKQDAGIAKATCSNLARRHGDFANAAPEVVLLYCIALQESGQVDAAADFFREQYGRLARTSSNTSAFRQLARCAPLFMPARLGRAYCEDTLERTPQSMDEREYAKCINNLGYCEADSGDYERATSHFAEAEQTLKKLGHHDVIFPSNNLAAMRMTAGDYGTARETFYQCIFQTRSQDYLGALRMNISICNSFLGFETQFGGLEELRNHPGILGHAYIESILEYLICLVTIKTKGPELTQLDINRMHERICTVRYPDVIVPFWNALCDHVQEKTGLTVSRLPTEGRLVVGALLDPRQSLVRPGLLVFGHL